MATFNCKNAKTSIDELKDLCKVCDILLLQETWLFNEESSTLININSDFYVYNLSSMNTENGVITGRPYGGLAIMWRKTLAKFSHIVTYDCSRLLGIEINTGNFNLLIVNVYLPYCAPSNTEEFQHYLGMIDSIMRECGSAKHVMVMGDFNADPRRVNGSVAHQFGKELSDLCMDDYE